MEMNQPFYICVILYLTSDFTMISSKLPYTCFSKLKGVSCENENVAFNVTRPSILSCVYKCQSTKDCKNVDYYGTSQTCVGCGGVMALSDELTERQGWAKKEEEIKMGKDGVEKEGGDEKEVYASDCFDHVTRYNATEDGVYVIKTPLGSIYSVYCLNSRIKVGLGWTVFLRRLNESESFNRTLKAYIEGFGRSVGNHWRGLEFLREMTNGANVDLIVLDGWWNERTQTVIYDEEIVSGFTVGPHPRYRISVGQVLTMSGGVFGYDSCIGASNNSSFSTNDRDLSGASCSPQRGYGGWWWDKECLGNPNGLYFGEGIERKDSTYCHIKGNRIVTTKELWLAFRKSGVFNYDVEHF